MPVPGNKFKNYVLIKKWADLGGFIPPYSKYRRVINMLELEETIKQLQELEEKLKNLGESL